MDQLANGDIPHGPIFFLSMPMARATGWRGDFSASFPNTSRVGRYGKAADARHLHKHALLLLDEAGYERRGPLLGATKNYLGRALRDLNMQSEALCQIDEALEIREKVYGQDNPWVATVLNNKGSVLSDLGFCSDACDLYECA